MRRHFVVLMAIVLGSLAWGQSAPASGQQSMPGMDMSGHDMSNMKDMPTKDSATDKEDPDTSAHAMHSMEGHMDMGPHMKMTALRKVKPGDAMRAQQVADEARKAAEQYTDYHKALAAGFRIF